MKLETEEIKKMRCYVCNQTGHGPLSRDAYGYRHRYDCSSGNTTLKPESNSSIPLVWHKGKMCIVNMSIVCQEDYCIGCMIYLNKVEGIT